MALAALTGPAAADWFRVSSEDVAAARLHEAGQRAGTARRTVAGPDAVLLTPQEWASYKAAFVAGDGRVVDVENGGISHSEGQGYGLILAVHADDRETFDRIWRFTRRELQVRGDDALLAWRYLPDQSPHVTDRNNATDGDVLVAYALLRGAARWQAPEYAVAADRIVRDIGRKLIAWEGGEPILKPAAYGFDSIPGNRGPVVNLSYYFYAAFDLFAVVQPDYPWAALARHGKTLTAEARTGRRNLVPNWVSVSRGSVRMAEGFARRASYDAVRIPLYMAYADISGFDLSAQDVAWNRYGPGAPSDRDLMSDAAIAPMADPGYRMIAALSACASRGVPIPPALMHYRSTTYFASSLHLLGLVAVRRTDACSSESAPVARAAPLPRVTPVSVLIGSRAPVRR
ncbi:glycosyl hydrolase family 8 [Acuticoccus sediminis]|nr:glycosyl hydrolase family 8 [Acuticoccus sediminis]